jgi:hypothetical protein
VRDTSTFLVAAGILAAVSVVWAQLWVQLWVDGNEVQEPPVLLGLAWTYTSVFLALLAAVLAGLCSTRSTARTVGKWPVGILTLAAFMVLVNIAQSLASTFTRLIWQKTLFEVLPFEWFWMAIATVVFAFFVILSWHLVEKVAGLSAASPGNDG